MSTYTQCELKQKTDAGTLVDIRWIPSSLAKMNSFIRVKETGELWQITAKFATKNWEEVNKDSRDYKHQREASDI